MSNRAQVVMGLATAALTAGASVDEAEDIARRVWNEMAPKPVCLDSELWGWRRAVELATAL